MTVTASPAHQRSLTAVADATSRRRDTWANRHQCWEVVEWEARQRGVQRELNSDLFENAWKTYNGIRKRAAVGVYDTSTRQLARDLYPDVGADIAAWERRRKSVQRWLRVLENGGLIRTTANRNAAGKSIGLRVELLPVSEVTALTRGCSSAG